MTTFLIYDVYRPLHLSDPWCHDSTSFLFKSIQHGLQDPLVDQKQRTPVRNYSGSEAFMWGGMFMLPARLALRLESINPLGDM